MKTLANIFAIRNVPKLSAEYVPFRIIGLKKDDNYYSNQNTLVDRLSRKYNHPVLIIDADRDPKIVVRNEEYIIDRLADKMPLVKTSVYFEQSAQPISLDFSSNNEEIRKICLRFLNFELRGQLSQNGLLFSPGTGHPFFQKEFELLDGLALHHGFISRVIGLPNGGYGVVIDSTAKVLSPRSVGVHFSKDKFDRFVKGKTLLYKYEDPKNSINWYEFKAWELDDLNVSTRDVKGEALIDLIRRVVPKPHPDYLSKLPTNASVVAYLNKGNDTRYAPLGMCYEVLEFQEANSRRIQEAITLAPQKRFNEIREIKSNFFEKLSFGARKLEITDEWLDVTGKNFTFPDFELGNNHVISSKDFFGSDRNLASTIAKERMNRLQDNTIGFYTDSPLPNCFLALPRSVNDGKGNLLIEMLKDNADQMYPHDKYDPQIISYEDVFDSKDYIEIAKSIVQTIKLKFAASTPAFGVVMIPRLRKTYKKDHDKLGATVIRELKKLNFTASVIHTDTIDDCVKVDINSEGNRTAMIVVDKTKNIDKTKRWNGYVKNVLINKILLTCNKWPFILKNPLAADITIGIDVIPKTQIAGFTLVDKHVKFIMTEFDDTDNKERLSSDQVESMIYSMILKYCEGDEGLKIKDIVIHRDGRILEPELAGIRAALEKLKSKWFVHPEVNVHVVEVAKSSFYSVRMFDVFTDKYSGKEKIKNPRNGRHFFIGNEAFICTTGSEFSHYGTSNPLCVRYKFGTMNKEIVLSDLFQLTTMAFTKPDYCSRYPITLKLNDVRLAEQASEYDEDAYKHVEKMLQEINIETR